MREPALVTAPVNPSVRGTCFLVPELAYGAFLALAAIGLHALEPGQIDSQQGHDTRLLGITGSCPSVPLTGARGSELRHAHVCGPQRSFTVLSK